MTGATAPTEGYAAAEPPGQPTAAIGAPVFLSPSSQTFDIGTDAAVTAKQPQTDGIKADMPQAESSPAPKPADQGQAPQADGTPSPGAPAAASAHDKEMARKFLAGL